MTQWQRRPDASFDSCFVPYFLRHSCLVFIRHPSLDLPSASEFNGSLLRSAADSGHPRPSGRRRVSMCRNAGPVEATGLCHHDRHDDARAIAAAPNIPRTKSPRSAAAEARKSAELLGAEYVCLEFRDLSIVVDNPSRGKVCEALRRARPDIVLTAPPVDYMTDHEHHERARPRGLLFGIGAELFDPPMGSRPRRSRTIPHLYYVDAVEGIDYFGHPLQPDFIVDVTADLRAQAKNAGLPRKPAELAPQAARHRRIPGTRRALVGRPRPRNRRQIRRSLPPTHRATRTRATIGWSNCCKIGRGEECGARVACLRVPRPGLCVRRSSTARAPALAPAAPPSGFGLLLYER